MDHRTISAEDSRAQAISTVQTRRGKASFNRVTARQSGKVVLPRDLQRSLRREPGGLTPAATLLLVGTVLLLSISALIVFRSSGGGDAPPPPLSASSSSPTATAPATTEPTTAARPTQVPTATQSPRSTGTVSSARAATATRAAASATTQRPLVTNGGCAMVLPPGFREETPQGGYYPALDQTGFAALDSFNTEGGQRMPEVLAQAFVGSTLSRVIQGYQQVGVQPSGDGYRIDYVATVGGQPGRGSVYFKTFGPIACGATLFTLDSSSLPFATTLDLMILSLQVAPASRPGTATPTR
jgi:hypothetical protein